MTSTTTINDGEQSMYEYVFDLPNLNETELLTCVQQLSRQKNSAWSQILLEGEQVVSLKFSFDISSDSPTPIQSWVSGDEATFSFDFSISGVAEDTATIGGTTWDFRITQPGEAESTNSISAVSTLQSNLQLSVYRDPVPARELKNPTKIEDLNTEYVNQLFLELVSCDLAFLKSSK
jgi:hypothetical protein